MRVIVQTYMGYYKAITLCQVDAAAIRDEESEGAGGLAYVGRNGGGWGMIFAPIESEL